MADNKITISLEVEGNAKVELKRAQDAVEDFANATQDGMKKASGAFAVFEGVLAAEAVKKGLELVKEAGKLLFETFITDGIKASSEYGESLHALATALKLSGDYTKDALDGFEKLASTVQRTSNVSDQAVLSQAAYAKSLGLSNAQTEQLLKAAVELSAVTGKDLDSSVKDLAKTYEGVNPKLLKHIDATRNLTVEQLRAGEAVRIIGERFAGSAEAQTKTYAGGIHQIAAAFEDVQKGIGNSITQNQTVIAVFSAVGDAMKDLADYVDGNRDALKLYISEGVVTAISGVQLLVSVFDVLIGSFNRVRQAVVNVGTDLDSLTLGAVGRLATAVKHVATDLGEALGHVATDVKAATEGSAGLEDFRARLDALEKSARASMEALRSGASEAGSEVENTGRKVRELTAVQKKLLDRADEIAKAAIDAQKTEAEKIQEQIEIEQAALDQRLGNRQLHEAALHALDQQAADNRVAYTNQFIQDTIAENELLRQLDEQKYADKIAQNQAAINELLKDEDQFSKAKLNYQLQQKKQEDQVNQQRLQAATTALNALATLQYAKTKELAAVGKAAAIASTTIYTYEAATKSYASLAAIPVVGPALGAAAAAAAIVAGLANVARISGVDLATGGEVPSGFPNDTFRANLTSGENVVDRSTNQGLKGMIADHQGMIPLLLAVVERLDRLQTHVQVNLGSKTVFDEVRSAYEQGRAFDV